MSSQFSVDDCQRIHPVKEKLLKRIIESWLSSLDLNYEIGVRIVEAAEMAQVNQCYLNHRGPTDVITFDYREREPCPGADKFIAGDIYVCIDEAIGQAAAFATSWQEELVRYTVHGILHLLGFDDRTARARTKMKTAEDRIVAELASTFSISALGTRSRLRLPAKRTRHG